MSSTTTLHPLHIPSSSPDHTQNLPQNSISNLISTKCTNSLQTLKQVHASILKTGDFRDHYIAGALIKCYANPRFETFPISLQLLEQVSQPNVFVWNCVIRGCVDNRENLKAISLYSEMVNSGSKTNKYTYPLVFKACVVEQAVEEGVQVHCHVVKHGFSKDRHIVSSLIQMYAKMGRVTDAKIVFDSIGNGGDVVCCNAMVDGYMKIGDVESARQVFEKMSERNVGSWNTMISGFMSNGMVEKAKKCFDEMGEKDEVSWSAMIDGFNSGGYFKEALEVFDQMQREKIEFSVFVLSSVLAACANVGALEQGEWIHTYIRRKSIFLDEVLGTSLIDMYAKCGRIDLAYDVFKKMKRKEVSSWNAMIGGFAMHGRAEDAIELFAEMQKCDNNYKPNDVTFVALLNACAHSGFVNKGLKYFIEMKETYKIEPKMEHYGCVVNLLGKAGFLIEAQNFITSMPMKPNGAIWGALLGACRVHGNVELGEEIGELLLEMEPENSGRYTLISNIYAKAGKWDKVEKLRVLMKERGVKTITGISMICVKGVVYEFKVGDSSHPQMKDIRTMLEKIIQRIEANGHVPNTLEVLFDISEEEKETSLVYHSEKIAIAFGILNTEPGRVIRVVKNLRVCGDCHSASKIISRVYNREIIVRDRVRFHHFKNGECSCKDFW